MFTPILLRGLYWDSVLFQRMRSGDVRFPSAGAGVVLDFGGAHWTAAVWTVQNSNTTSVVGMLSADIDGAELMKW